MPPSSGCRISLDVCVPSGRCRIDHTVPAAPAASPARLLRGPGWQPKAPPVRLPRFHCIPAVAHGHGYRSGQAKGRIFFSHTAEYRPACRCRFADHHRQSHTDKRVDNNLGANIVKCVSLTSNPEPGNTPAERLFYARTIAGLSIASLAKLASLSTVSISKIENGGNFKVTTIKSLASALSQPIWFLGCYEQLPESTFGERILKARLYHGMTIEEFAAASGFNSRTIRKWEHGIVYPSKDSIAKLDSFLAILQN